MESRNICKFNLYRSGDLSCADFVYETDGAQASEQYAERYALGLVCEGEGTLLQAGRTHTLREGCLFAVLQGERFCVQGTGLVYSYITFSGRRADEIVERRRIRGIPICLPRPRCCIRSRICARIAVRKAI